MLSAYFMWLTLFCVFYNSTKQASSHLIIIWSKSIGYYFGYCCDLGHVRKGELNNFLRSVVFAPSTVSAYFFIVWFSTAKYILFFHKTQSQHLVHFNNFADWRVGLSSSTFIYYPDGNWFLYTYFLFVRFKFYNDFFICRFLISLRLNILQTLKVY